MKPFLKHIAEIILEDHPTEKLQHVTVVLPSRRAGLFIRKYFSEILQKTYLSPRIITINEIIEEIAGFKAADSTVLLFELYEMYREEEGTAAESFESFSRWGQIMLGDFNETDRYLVDAKKLFGDLRNIQEIEDWSFNDPELSGSQMKYLNFWSKLGVYYGKFAARCKKESIYPSGMIYRIASDSILEKINSFTDKSIYIAGFNAISASEEKIIETLCLHGKARFFADGDSYYVENKQHEAGNFIRRLSKKDWFEKSSIGNDYKLLPKNISMAGVPGNTLQALTAAQILGKVPPNEWNDTVLVLADEQLLLPVINALPAEVESVNITMGYSLKFTSLYSFISALFELQRGIKHSNKSSQKLRFYKPDILRILSNAECQSLADTDISEIIRKLMGTAKSFYTSDELNSLLERNEKLKKLFYPWVKVPDDVFQLLESTLEKLHSVYAIKRPLQQEFVFHALNSIRKLKLLLTKYSFELSMDSLQKIILKQLRETSVAFFGEPLRGLQLVGMLESRALDFKNVILLSANEDVLPKGNTEQSLIPYDLKKFHHLPTFQESDAVFAHHFYRLLQRAGNIHLIYNSEGNVTGGGEKSRFLLQLENELPIYNPKVKLEKLQMDFNSGTNEKNHHLSIKNASYIISRINEMLEKGISPSALSGFNNCKLDFFYKYIIGLREDDSDENIDDAKFGNIVHKILQESYKPLLDKKLHVDDFKNCLAGLKEATEKMVALELPHADISTGKNYLSKRAVYKYCERMMLSDQEMIKENELVFKNLEFDLQTELEIFPWGESKMINVKGISDRIDKLNGELRIIDYKTGNVESKDLIITDAGQLKERSKALQLFIYAVCALKKTGVDGVQSLITNLRQAENTDMPLKIFNSTRITEEHTILLQKALSEIIEEMLDENTLFEHNPESKYCIFCNS